MIWTPDLIGLLKVASEKDLFSRRHRHFLRTVGLCSNHVDATRVAKEDIRVEVVSRSRFELAGKCFLFFLGYFRLVSILFGSF